MKKILAALVLAATPAFADPLISSLAGNAVTVAGDPPSYEQLLVLSGSRALITINASGGTIVNCAAAHSTQLSKPRNAPELAAFVSLAKAICDGSWKEEDR